MYQALTQHFWQRWSMEYIASLRRLTKWRHPTRNIQVGTLLFYVKTISFLRKARVIEIHAGGDKLVRVVTVKTSTGTYKRPVTKMAALLPDSQDWVCEHCYCYSIKTLVLAGGMSCHIVLYCNILFSLVYLTVSVIMFQKWSSVLGFG